MILIGRSAIKQTCRREQKKRDKKHVFTSYEVIDADSQVVKSKMYGNPGSQPLINVTQWGTLPRAPKRRHRVLSRRRVAPFGWRLWSLAYDRPEPAAICWRGVRPHDATERASIMVEHFKVVWLA